MSFMRANIYKIKKNKKHTATKSKKKEAECKFVRIKYIVSRDSIYKLSQKPCEFVILKYSFLH